MSSAVIHAPSQPFFPGERLFRESGHSGLLELPYGVVPGSRLEVRPAPITVSSGIAEIDALTGGLPRGALTEFFGPASSGRTSCILAALAEATRRQEVCALVDAGDSLHPDSAAGAGIDLQRLLWVRCGNNLPQEHRDTEEIEELKNEECRITNQKPASSPQINTDQHGSKSIHYSSFDIHPFSRNPKLEPRNYSGHWPLTNDHRVANHQSSISNRQFSAWDHRLAQVLKTTDLLLQSGGFGMVVVDLADVPPRFARRIPLASWFRFRRAVENTPTVLLAVEQEPYAKTCASLVLRTQASALSIQDSASEPFLEEQNLKGRRTPAQKLIFSNELPAHAQILQGMPVEAEVVHARLQRKPAHSVAQFHTRASWADSAAG